MLRNTWVKYAREKGVCVYFLIGLDTNQTKQEEINLEAKEYQDLIQGKFIENYHNLTLKTISLLRWANIHCKQDQFVMKVDDDVIFHIDWFLEHKDQFIKGIFFMFSDLVIITLLLFFIKEYMENTCLISSIINIEMILV